MRFRSVLRFARRDLRGGVSGLRVLIACVALGVFSIVGVNSLSHALSDTLANEGRTILGGDAAFSLMHRDLSDGERGFLSSRGTLSTVEFARAMARDAAGDAAVVELKAVSPNWPTLGQATLSPAIDVDSALRSVDGVDGLAVDEALLDRLKLKLGDHVSIGDATFAIRATLVSEPDRLAIGIGFGPRVLMSQAALQASGLAGPDALVRYTTRITLGAAPPPQRQVDAFLAEAKARFPDAGWETRTRQNVSPDFSRNLDRFAEYLTLIGLVSLIVGGVGVAIAARGFVERKRATLAILKSVGASGAEAAGVLILEFLAIAAIGVVIGILLGAATPYLTAGLIGALLPLPLTPSLYPAVAALGALYGFATALAFALPALGRAHDEKPMATFRAGFEAPTARPRPRYLIGAAASFALLGFCAALASPQHGVALATILATLVAFALLRLAGLGLVELVRRAPAATAFSWRIALANIGRPGAPTSAIVLALGLGFAALIALTLIDVNLRGQLRAAAEGRTPSFYFLDVRGGDYERFRAFLNSATPGAKIVAAPMMRGRIVKVAGVPAEDVKASDSVAWALEGDRGITFSESPPEGSKIVEGEWWAKDYAGPPLVSFDADLAKGLGLKLGDAIAVNVLGRTIEARIANLREIDWRTFAMNFVMVFSPNAFRGAPFSDLVSLAAPKGVAEASERSLVAAAAREFPDVVTIPVRQAIETIDALLAKLALAIRLASSVALAAATLVLAAALAADRQARLFESVVLKTLGATRGLLLRAAAQEYALVGGAAALFGVAVGTLAAYVVVVRLFKFDFTFALAPALAAAIGGPIVTIALGLLGHWRALAAKPAQVLREL